MNLSPAYRARKTEAWFGFHHAERLWFHRLRCRQPWPGKVPLPILKKRAGRKQGKEIRVPSEAAVEVFSHSGIMLRVDSPGQKKKSLHRCRSVRAHKYKGSGHGVGYFLNLRLMPSSPTNPEPSSQTAAGIGTTLGPACKTP